MKRYFKSLIIPPVFEDGSKTTTAQRLYKIIHAIILLIIVFSIPFFLFPHILSLRYATVTAFLVPVCLIFLEAARRGQVNAASYGLISTLWLVATVGAITAGGIRAPIVMGYLIIIIISSLLLGSRATISLTGLSLLSGLGMAYAEGNDWLPTSKVTYSPYSIFLIYTFFILAVLVLQNMAWRTVNTVLRSLQTELNERKRAETGLKQRADEMYLLYQMGKALTSGEDLYHALRAMVKELRHLMTVDAFYVGIYDEETDIISFPLYLNLDDDLQVPPRNLSEHPGLTASVIKKRQTIHIPDVAAPEIQKAYNIVVIIDMDVHSYIGIPLINEGRIIGLMSVQAREPNAYTDDQVRMLETLASQVAITIEKAHLLQQLQQELAERKQIETALRESEARLRAVIDQIPYDLWVCDAEGRYTIQNQAGERFFPNTIGKMPLELVAEGVPLEAAQRWEDEHRRALNGEVVHAGPYDEIIGGQRYSYIITVAPITIDERVIGLTGLSVDVTELRNAEAEVRKLNDELEKRIAERTIELEQANQSLQAFSYSVSHDLRAPLRSIRSFGQILTNDFSSQLDPEAKGFLEKITNSADEMNALIDSLLSLFRFSQGAMHRRPVDLSTIASTVLEKLCHTEPDRTVSCRVTEGLIANADEALLRNVLENLLGNAWKYSARKNEAQIEFSAETRNGETIYFVRDNGAGFDMNYAGKLFQPFQRLHHADEFPGYGIGLATVQRIIQRHGGRIWAEAKPEQGATFYFTLG